MLDKMRKLDWIGLASGVAVVGCIGAPFVLMALINKDFADAESVALANEKRCIPNLIGFDVCEEAKKISIAANEDVPAVINGVEVLRYWADGPVINVQVKLPYDILEEPRVAFLAASHEEFVETQVCEEGPTRAFLGLGGSLRYDYRYRNGAQFNTIGIDAAACETRSGETFGDGNPDVEN